MKRRKCRSVFKEGCSRYKRLKKRLETPVFQEYEEHLLSLDKALQEDKEEQCIKEAQWLQKFLQKKGKKSPLEHSLEFVFALSLAILIAFFARGLWFEFYDIPTGSMRPTFKEHDYVLVQKSAFGVNTPLQTSHLYFDRNLLQRGSMVVFTVDGLDIEDPDTTYFMLFPGKKRYVKRCIGLPGDTLYFYGGRLHGIDKNGNEITEFQQSPFFTHREYIPFISFEGKQENSLHKNQMEVLFKQMNQPVGKLALSDLGYLQPKKQEEHRWIDDNDFLHRWGMKNYSMCRIIEAEDLPQKAIDLGYEDETVDAYLEIRHSATLPVLPMQMDEERQLHTSHFVSSYLKTEYSWIPLTEPLLQKLHKSLYTSRLVVRNGSIYRYSFEEKQPRGKGVFLSSDIPDGTYEFFDGVAYKINGYNGTKPLEKSHPIYPTNWEMTKALFNGGIEPAPLFNPTPSQSAKMIPTLFPPRYAYFKSGDLFIMNQPLLHKNDSELESFINLEKLRKDRDNLYTSFLDNGRPSIELIKEKGLHIPENHYLVLGDNHAGSADGRVFGFVPEKNMQGIPVAILWPPSSRWGIVSQPFPPFFSFANVVVSLIALIFIVVFSMWMNYLSGRKRLYKNVRR